MTNEFDVYQNIKSVASATGVTLASLADSLGVTRQTLNSVMKSPSYSTLQRISVALGIPMWRLLITPAEYNSLGGTGSECSESVTGEGAVSADAPWSVADNVKRVLKERGLTFERVATRMTPPTSRGNLSQMISNNPTVATLRRVADAVGCDISEFFATGGAVGCSTPAVGSARSVAESGKSEPQRDERTLAERIEDSGLTLTQVAKRMRNDRGGVGISPSVLRTMLRGTPSIDRLREIAGITGIPYAELIDGRGIPADGFTAVMYRDGVRYGFDSEADALAQLRLWAGEQA